MTIQAQPPSRLLGPPRPPDRPRSASRLRPADDRPHPAERPTLGLDPHSPFIVDAFEVLDHRTRSRTIPLPAAPPGRYLSVEHGEEIHLIPLDRPIVHLGRGLSADIRIEDAQVSRRHAIIAQRGEGARVLDDRSSNGTFVNGRGVTVADMTDGDVLRLGRVVFRFVEIPPAVRARPVRRFPLTAVKPRRLAAA
ncbi:MAG: FHA domain-containing protein [Solirubrobacteraceae bacterium]